MSGLWGGTFWTNLAISVQFAVMLTGQSIIFSLWAHILSYIYYIRGTCFVILYYNHNNVHTYTVFCKIAKICIQLATSSVSMYFYWEEILQFLHYSLIYLFWEAVDMKGNVFSYSFEIPIGIMAKTSISWNSVWHCLKLFEISKSYFESKNWYKISKISRVSENWIHISKNNWNQLKKVLRLFEKKFWDCLKKSFEIQALLL